MKHLPACFSDHRPILVSTIEVGNLGPKPFRFERFWLDDNTIVDVVREAWHIQVHGTPAFVLTKKVKVV